MVLFHLEKSEANNDHPISKISSAAVYSLFGYSRMVGAYLKRGATKMTHKSISIFPFYASDYEESNPVRKGRPVSFADVS